MTDKTDRSPVALSPVDLSHVRHWIFDLDNTLYPRRCDLFSQIDIKMTQFVSELLGLPHDQARKVQKDYYRDHGTTLQGLMTNHNVDPHDFLDAVHDIDYSPVQENQSLRHAIQALPGQKLIFTNGDVPHAERTTKALGIEGCFDGIFDIVAAEFMPKPAATPYQQFINKFDVVPHEAIMFEDLARNLLVPKSMGMATVLMVDQQFEHDETQAWEADGHKDDHIDHVADDLAGFLWQIGG